MLLMSKAWWTLENLTFGRLINSHVCAELHASVWGERGLLRKRHPQSEFGKVVDQATAGGILIRKLADRKQGQCIVDRMHPDLTESRVLKGFEGQLI